MNHIKRCSLIGLFLASVASFLVPVSLSQAAEDSGACSATMSNLQTKNSNLTSALAGIDSLLNAKGIAEMPLTVLFLVDLQDDEAITKRISDLSVNSEAEKVIEQSEYKDYQQCSLSTEDKVLLEDTIQKQALLNQKRLGFLKLEKPVRQNLIDLFESARQSSVDHRQINKELSDGQLSLVRAQTNLIMSEKEASERNGLTNEDSASVRPMLDSYLVDVETEHIDFLNNVKSEREKLEELRKELAEHTKSKYRPAELQSELASVDEIWRSAANSLLHTFEKINASSKFTLPPLPTSTSINKNEKELYSENLALLEKARQRSVELSNQRQNLILNLKALHFRLVSDAGTLRARLIADCKASSSCDNHVSLNERTITGVLTELRIFPLKFLAGGFNKIVEFKGKTQRGFDGWADVSRQLFIFFALILLPFLAHKTLNFVSHRLDLTREKIMSQSILDYGYRTQIAVWLSRLTPFVPSIGMILSIDLARALIEATDIEEVSYFLFYLEVYFVYKATRLLLKVLFEFLFSSESLTLSQQLSERAEKSARRLSRFFFARYILLHIIEDTLRRSLVYGILYEAVGWVSLLFVINEIRQWQNEIVQLFSTRFSTLWVRIKPQTESKVGALIYPILLLFVVAHDVFRLISLRLVKFDFFKRIISEVFKKQLEKEGDVSKTLGKPNSDYLAIFDYHRPAAKEVYVDRDPQMAKQILANINCWLEGETSEDLFMLVGHRGIGKTTSLKMIFDSIQIEDKFFRWIKPKICEPTDLFDLISEIFGKKICSIEDFLQAEAALDQKVVLVIDDIHNLFIGKVGGFEAYRLFIDLVSLRTTKIFWCLSANSHAWTYLKGVFGEEHFYGQVYKMRMWSDSEIQSLILARHQMSGYSQYFDRSITAYGTGNLLGEQVETQFFRLLWGQSRGNPRSALMYWISAVAQTGDSEIHVGVPRFINPERVGTMSNDALIVLAALARHDSLTLEELTEVTRIDQLVVRKVLIESENKELVWSDEQRRVRISSRGQNAIDYFLLGKNFLYE